VVSLVVVGGSVGASVIGASVIGASMLKKCVQDVWRTSLPLCICLNRFNVIAMLLVSIYEYQIRFETRKKQEYPELDAALRPRWLPVSSRRISFLDRICVTCWHVADYLHLHFTSKRKKGFQIKATITDIDMKSLKDRLSTHMWKFGGETREWRVLTCPIRYRFSYRRVAQFVSLCLM
jgi:hypothetical protein